VEHSYVSAKTMVCTVGGLISVHLVAFAEWLVEQQYSESYAFLIARQALAFGRWCNDRRLSFCALKDSASHDTSGCIRWAKGTNPEWRWGGDTNQATAVA
jgi:hypothetical protein